MADGATFYSIHLDITCTSTAKWPTAQTHMHHCVQEGYAYHKLVVYGSLYPLASRLLRYPQG